MNGAAASPRVVVMGTNWLGDSVMSMPALQALKARHPQGRLTLCVKPGLAALWALHDAVDAVIVAEAGMRGTAQAARAVRRCGAGRALVFPNSFRSALIPFAARVPERVGLRGHQRAWMLTRVATPPDPAAKRHQVWEYLRIAGLDGDSVPEAPRLRVPPALRETCRADFRLTGEHTWAALLPGAARGPSKRWPAERFAAVGRRFREAGVRVAVLGTAAEAPLCRRVAEGAGEALNLAGRTTLPEYAAVLSLCRCAVGNDSGGTHLAAAVGSRVVTVFGLTDPEQTAPLGEGHRIVAAEGPRSRDLPRRSREARARLAGIEPERVWAAARAVLETPEAP
ncbi:MAG: lipopolysaccharide heptosyltransferase II [Lentisphaerae bacterium]|nr:lipopolysaccharide heptosyltransferase II [Lentisphaerota bacterium]